MSSRAPTHILPRGRTWPKILIAEGHERFQPSRSPVRYPKYARDLGIEQDFLSFLKKSYPMTVTSLSEADFVYIPFFWTRYHLHNNYGRSGLGELQEAVSEITKLGVKAFTVCQYADGPLVHIDNCSIFLGSRKTNEDLDVPLLVSRLPGGFTFDTSKYLFNFIGRIDTHPIREDLVAALGPLENGFVFTDGLSPRRYSRVLHQSEITLAPRGYGGSSFRFYEAIQAGSVPWLIGDIDTRPFKNQIEWDKFSLYSRTVSEFIEQFEGLTDTKIRGMREEVKKTLSPLFRLGNWSWLLIQELSESGQGHGIGVEFSHG